MTGLNVEAGSRPSPPAYPEKSKDLVNLGLLILLSWLVQSVRTIELSK